MSTQITFYHEVYMEKDDEYDQYVTKKCIRIMWANNKIVDVYKYSTELKLEDLLSSETKLFTIQ